MAASPATTFALPHRSDVATLKVFHVPDTILTQAVIPPSKLETFKGVHVRESADATTIDAAFAAIADTHPRPTTEAAEQRWKLVMLDAHGTRIGEISCASKQRLGIVGRAPVAFASDAFAAFLRAHFD